MIFRLLIGQNKTRGQRTPTPCRRLVLIPNPYPLRFSHEGYNIHCTVTPLTHVRSKLHTIDGIFIIIKFYHTFWKASPPPHAHTFKIILLLSRCPVLTLSQAMWSRFNALTSNVVTFQRSPKQRCHVLTLLQAMLSCFNALTSNPISFQDEPHETLTSLIYFRQVSSPIKWLM